VRAATLLSYAGLMDRDDEAFDEEQGEHFVAVCWKSKVEELPGVWERGFYSAMGIVTKPRSPKWIFTIDRLSSLWGIK
ncbi:MAG: hypothetical protein OXH59_17445, partial [Rhodospirillaceae bacterium]|nr:hypothetical protein [Rhodospirillaceae bacterium]